MVGCCGGNWFTVVDRRTQIGAHFILHTNLYGPGKASCAKVTTLECSESNTHGLLLLGVFTHEYIHCASTYEFNTVFA